MFNSKLKDLRQDGLVDAVNLIGISGVDANRSGLYRLKRIRFENLGPSWLVVWNMHIFPYIGDNHPN